MRGWDSYVTFGEWIGDRRVATLGTNVGSTEIPFQGWRRFKEAFAPELIEKAATSTVGKIQHIVDPFGGSGTTAIAAQFLGIKPTTIEVNPFLADLIKAKIATYDLDLAAHQFSLVAEGVWRRKPTRNPCFPGSPKTFVEPGVDGRFIFSKAIASRILDYRATISELSDPKLKRLFSVILGASVVAASNIIVSGKGRRYRRQWQQHRATPEFLDSIFHEGVLQALHDLKRYERRRCRDFSVIQGDARTLTPAIEPCDLAVFSPPYPNSFDYTDVYNVELWALGYLAGRSSNSELRNSTLRSHVQIKRDMTATKLRSPRLTKTLKALRLARPQLWNKNIPEMIAAYFSDMEIILGAISQRLRTKGRVYMIVGDSRYAGINIQVAEILCDLAPAMDYTVRGIEACRSMRASPQQGGRAELPESLIVLEKR